MEANTLLVGACADRAERLKHTTAQEREKCLRKEILVTHKSREFAGSFVDL
jgi:hypothetical protein